MKKIFTGVSYINYILVFNYSRRLRFHTQLVNCE